MAHFLRRYEVCKSFFTSVMRSQSTFWILWIPYLCSAELGPTFIIILHSEGYFGFLDKFTKLFSVHLSQCSVINL